MRQDERYEPLRPPSVWPIVTFIIVAAISILAFIMLINSTKREKDALPATAPIVVELPEVEPAPSADPPAPTQD